MPFTLINVIVGLVFAAAASLVLDAPSWASFLTYWCVTGCLNAAVLLDRDVARAET